MRTLRDQTISRGQRIGANFVVLFSLFYFPWWVTMLLAVLCLFMFEHYFEILIVGIVIDSLFNTAWHGHPHFQFVLSVVCLIVYSVSFPLKRRLVLYRN